MPFPVFLEVGVRKPHTKAKLTIFALGATVTEPRVGGRLCFPACGNFAEIEIEKVVEHLDESAIFVCCKEIDHTSVSDPGPDISAEDVANGIADSLQKLGWILCDDNGNKLGKKDARFQLMEPFNSERLLQEMRARKMTNADLAEKVSGGEQKKKKV